MRSTQSLCGTNDMATVAYDQYLRSAEIRDATEHYYARHGYAMVSLETAREIERIEDLNYLVSFGEIQDVLYAIYSGPYGNYYRPKILA